jgi:hypothetical protein
MADSIGAVFSGDGDKDLVIAEFSHWIATLSQGEFRSAYRLLRRTL